MNDKTQEIIIFENQDVKLEVNLRDETVWLTQQQMSELFDRDRKTITRHIQNIYKDKELEEKQVCSNFEHTGSDGKKYQVNYYNLDMIISVGYRVKSKQGTAFRIWANKVLKDYILQGYAINQKRLEALEKTVKLIEIANRSDDLADGDARQVLKLINDYYRALDTLENYDNNRFTDKRGHVNNERISYRDCAAVIDRLKYKRSSDLFGQERQEGLRSIIGNIYQSFDGQDVYPSVEEKAANFFYLLIKNHPFCDGNKRIAATLLIYFLDFYGLLYQRGEKIIDNIALTSLTLLVAQSNPKEKELMIALVVDMLHE